MKVVILAGGFGTRLAEETRIRPKPMVEIGEYPIIWHIMKHYSHFGFNEFYIALGYKGEAIKEYFMQYAMLQSDMSISLQQGAIEMHHPNAEDWRIHLINTGLNTMTGGRLKRLQPFLQDESFMLTYGDGVSNIDLGALLAFHRQHGRIGTVSAVRPPARFGSLLIGQDQVVSQFKEKTPASEGWINGGFFVFETAFFEYLHDDKTVMESDALEPLAANGQLVAYQHPDFWQCMDTLRDKRHLESLWESGHAPWKVWET
jgi:glucose-1-phosphate cytidylyltransferase